MPLLPVRSLQKGQPAVKTNLIEIPEQFPDRILELAQQSLSYLTYNAPVQAERNAQMSANTLSITLRQAYQPLAVYRDFIRLDKGNSEEPVTP